MYGGLGPDFQDGGKQITFTGHLGDATDPGIDLRRRRVGSSN